MCRNAIGEFAKLGTGVSETRLMTTTVMEVESSFDDLLSDGGARRMAEQCLFEGMLAVEQTEAQKSIRSEEVQTMGKLSYNQNEVRYRMLKRQFDIASTSWRIMN